MVHKAGMSVLFGIGLLTAACGVGDDDDFKPDPIDLNPNGVVCSAAFAITGTFAAGTPARPVEVPTGCWPVGLWTFTAAIDPAADVLDIDGDGKGDRCGTVAGTAAPSLA